MPRVRDLWTRLVRVALRKERTGAGAYGRPGSGIAGHHHYRASHPSQFFENIVRSIPNNGKCPIISVNPILSVNGNNLRSLPIYIRGVSLLVVRTMLGIASVADASSPRSRADLLTLGLAVINILISWFLSYARVDQTAYYAWKHNSRPICQLELLSQVHRVDSVSSAGILDSTSIKKANSEPLSRHGDPMKKSSGPQAEVSTSVSRQNSGPLPPVLPTTGLVTSGPIFS
ncbi:hypothetical protein F0562_019698 [Nyssa sinensis]|uniref:Uncharacterized protein n=1 Tax=Nyssa sinensis TaxID=561372 RepID=A0A5J5BT04_9ASTE|nr:hypothetical protein F0562_019698 [Nyssa sinensis]